MIILPLVEPPPIELPELDWLLLGPMALVLGAAVVGVMVEAFAPRSSRRTIQLVLTFGSLIGAFVLVVLAAGSGGPVMASAAVIDGPALFLQGGILLVALLAALTMAERHVDPSGDAFAARASAMPGSEDERQFTARGYLQTEVWPLFLFAVGGMMLFPASNDLLTMFVAFRSSTPNHK